MPDRMSSAITPAPPGKFSIRRMPNGLKISKRRNRTNAASIHIHSPADTAKSATHVPTISSTTTREGSSPHTASRRLAAHTPASVNTSISPIVIHNRHSAGKAIDNRHHATAASKAPAVPGATGQKPAPNPVPISMGRKGACRITYQTIRKARQQDDKMVREVTFPYHLTTLSSCHAKGIILLNLINPNSWEPSRPPCCGWSLSPCATG